MRANTTVFPVAAPIFTLGIGGSSAASAAERDPHGGERHGQASQGTLARRTDTTRPATRTSVVTTTAGATTIVTTNTGTSTATNTIGPMSSRMSSGQSSRFDQCGGITTAQAETSGSISAGVRGTCTARRTMAACTATPHRLSTERRSSTAMFRLQVRPRDAAVYAVGPHQIELAAPGFEPRVIVGNISGVRG
jgi:hypothetical protein